LGLVTHSKIMAAARTVRKICDAIQGVISEVFSQRSCKIFAWYNEHSDIIAICRVP